MLSMVSNVRGATMPGPDVLIVADDPNGTERELAAGELTCPDCRGELRPWRHARPGGCAPATDADTSAFDGAAAATAAAPTCSCPG
jgi:hypothetical protein